MPNKINIIYLLGAGRSGTTLLATLLNSHPKIDTLGEMHQFYEFLAEDKNCSCGEKLKNCTKWDISEKFLTKEIKKRKDFLEKEEAHKNIPRLLFKNIEHKKYLAIQEETFAYLQQHRKSSWYVDSSKYIARFLLLKKSKKLNLKGIYFVRDPRGVVYSFQKKVQTPKSPISALIYYNIINFFGEWVYRTNRDILKIRYEDLVENPLETLSKIYSHIFEEKTEAEELSEYFTIPHIVGGNRLKSKQRIKIQPDVKWKKEMSKLKRNIVFLMSLPFILANKYYDK